MRLEVALNLVSYREIIRTEISQIVDLYVLPHLYIYTVGNSRQKATLSTNIGIMNRFHCSNFEAQTFHIKSIFFSPASSTFKSLPLLLLIKKEGYFLQLLILFHLQTFALI